MGPNFLFAHSLPVVLTLLASAALTNMFYGVTVMRARPLNSMNFSLLICTIGSAYFSIHNTICRMLSLHYDIILIEADIT